MGSRQGMLAGSHVLFLKSRRVVPILIETCFSSLAHNSHDGLPINTDFEGEGRCVCDPHLWPLSLFRHWTRRKTNRAVESLPARRWGPETQIQMQVKNDPLAILPRALPCPSQLFAFLSY